MSPALLIRDLCCVAGGQAVLEIGSLQIAPGERVGVLGPNGAGKSTLLRALGGFVVPAHGTIDVLSQRVAPRPSGAALRALRRDVGAVMQGLHLVPRLSAFDNVLIGSLSRVRGWRGWTRVFPAAEQAAARQALTDVGLQDRVATRADRLSGGERQKVAIARLLLQRPRLILADEPTAALDPAAAAETCRLLADAARGATLITVVHNPALLPLLCERVVGLRDGRIAFDLPLAAVGDNELSCLYHRTTCGPAATYRNETASTTPSRGTAAVAPDLAGT